MTGLRGRGPAGSSGERAGRRGAAVGLLLLLLLAFARPASAQEQRDPAPLTKSELIRLLSGTTYTDAEIEGIVRRSCLSFEPTRRDWESFRELGAGDDLVAAIRACGGGSVLRVALETDRIETTAGDTVPVRVTVRDEAGPRPDVQLVLRERDGGDEGEGATGPGYVATTDSAGAALFRVAAGDGAGTRRLRVAAAEARVEGETDLTLVTTEPEAVAEADERTEPDLGREPAADRPDARDAPAPDGRETLAADDRARAAAALEDGRVREAARAYESVVRRAPDDVAAWLGLGYARVELGREREARRAFRRVLELEEEHEEAREALQRLGGFPAFLELTMWGGEEFGGDRGAGFRFARAALRPEPGLRVWAEYDDALHLNRPALVRGGDPVKGYFAGAALAWGPGDAPGPFTTELEIGRRSFSDLVQNYYRLEQGVSLSPTRIEGEPAFRAAVGGLLGRRFDRDDWQLYARLELPVRSDLALKSSLHVGETLGTNTRETGRSPERERRVTFAVDYRPLASVRIEPSVGAGRVESDLDEPVESDAEDFSGLLLEGGLRLEVPITMQSRGELYLRHQAPPGTPAFTVLGIGLTVGIDG